MSVDALFVDSNILVYAHDRSAGEKHAIARQKLGQLWVRPLPPSLSVQVLQEFFVNLVRKKVEPVRAREVVENYLAWQVIDNDKALFLEGFTEQERWQLSFWDALILVPGRERRSRGAGTARAEVGGRRGRAEWERGRAAAEPRR